MIQNLLSDAIRCSKAVFWYHRIPKLSCYRQASWGPQGYGAHDFRTYGSDCGNEHFIRSGHGGAHALPVAGAASERETIWGKIPIVSIMLCQQKRALGEVRVSSIKTAVDSLYGHCVSVTLHCRLCDCCEWKIHLFATIRTEPQCNCKNVVSTAAQAIFFSKQLLPITRRQAVWIVHENNGAHLLRIAGTRRLEQCIRWRKIRTSRIEQKGIKMLKI